MQAGYYFDDSSKVWKKNDSEDDVLKPGFFIQVQVNTVGIEDNQRIVFINVYLTELCSEVL